MPHRISRHELNEPIGIGAVAAALTADPRSHVQVESCYAPLGGMPTAAQLARCDILGISMPLGRLDHTQRLVARWRALPKTDRPVLVLGGLTPTFATEEVLSAFPEAIVVLGEGEDAMAGLVSAVRTGPRGELRSRLAQAEVPNLVFRTSVEGDSDTVRTPRRLVDMGTARPPARDWVDSVAQRCGIVRAEASRGCSWGRCTFCAIQHKYCDQAQWREIPIPRVVSELEQLSKAGVRHPYYTDEDFVGSDPARALALAQAIDLAKAQGRIAPDLSLYVDMRVASVLDTGQRGQPSGLQVLGALKQAGLREVFVGIESGSKEQVRRYKKPATAARNLKALRLLRELGITVDIGFIFFDPEMSLGEAAANLDFLREANLWHHDARLTKEVRVEAGTPLVEQYRAKGLLAGSMDIDELTFPYRWLDRRVEAVHVAFRAWDAQEKERIYEAQAATRGEVPTEALRRRRRKLLGRIRAVELDALQALVGVAQSGGDPAAASRDTESLKRFSDQRHRLLEVWAQAAQCAA